MQGAVQLTGHPFWSHPITGEKVRPADVADEQRVTGEHTMWDAIASMLVDDEADRLRRMTGCRANLQLHLAETNALAVPQMPDGELRLRRLAVPDGRARSFGQLEVTRDEVRMDVRLDHPLDSQTMLLCICEIDGDVALRINDDRAPGGLVGDEVGRV